MTIHSLWTEAVGRYSDLPALGWVDETPWTYREVDRKVRTLQARFRAPMPGFQGLSSGDRVALWAPNHPGWGVVYLAVTTGPLVVVPILPDFSPHDVANVLTHSEAKVLVVGRALWGTWTTWLSEASEEERVALDAVQVYVLEELVDEPIAEVVPEDPTLPRPSADDLAALIYTSGTTGASKGVMLSHRNLTSNARAASPIPGYRPGDKQLSILPLAHTYEFTLGFLIPLIEGVHISYMSKPASPTYLLPALASVRPHAMLTVPLFMEKIYRSKVRPGLTKGLAGKLGRIPGVGWLLIQVAGAKLRKTFGGRMKFFGIGGAPLAPEVAAFLHSSRFPYAIGYGLTETSPLVAGHLKGRLHSTGRVLRGVEVKIAEPRNDVGAGEILVRGPNVMMGYYKDPGRTAEVLSAEGWFRTGDLGLFDRKQHLHIKGRSKNVILGPSGENIYPEAIEALINQDRLVVESLVLQRGQDIVAKVVVNAEVLKEIGQAAESYLLELRQEINRKLSRFSRLSFFEVHPEPFEKTATLKIKRYLYA